MGLYHFAAGTRLAGGALTSALTGKTLAVGKWLEGGPFAWQLRADGTMSILAGPARRERWTGTWRVDDRDRFCRTLNENDARELCLVVVANDARLQLFDRDGLMRLDAEVE